MVSVVRPARLTHLTVLQRAVEISDEIEDSIIAWRTEASVFNGIKGWVKVAAITWGGSIMPDGKEREAVVTVTVGVNARK